MFSTNFGYLCKSWIFFVQTLTHDLLHRVRAVGNTFHNHEIEQLPAPEEEFTDNISETAENDEELSVTASDCPEYELPSPINANISSALPSSPGTSLFLHIIKITYSIILCGLQLQKAVTKP